MIRERERERERERDCYSKELEPPAEDKTFVCEAYEHEWIVRRQRSVLAALKTLKRRFLKGGVSPRFACWRY
ncbi:hypothetical protein Y032_0081g1459 [Ancylostoma ceylanicum]|uniref:Uncharacterized protein n=1 Tax=Ancylostoma ceylanicum TaxID=53326 RepID=A0A016TS76_9BILA|nr:hypothetical protein Y032_0081g1459 [Ancylostoma ceylanicum]